ncbi:MULTISPECIES: recombinase family protein [Streptomyces]|uniref:recombinase family protein n=1 Tax=Streptomyces TaxID=1883 RepID=UPI002E79ED8A|nr:recombinase family protein [Streptomyces sp. BE282]MEE1734040.1 recombinase family protein [Streptomyces sp. BE282]MEE1734809.1 recombinase family protein [Streptomyces sp. BE282]
MSHNDGGPLLFGYMRVPDDMTDEEVQQKQADMGAYAEVEGFTLTTVFHEFVNGGINVFSEMADAIQRAEARHVIVPSYRDLALTRPLQDAMALHLEQTAGAQIVSLDERA